MIREQETFYNDQINMYVEQRISLAKVKGFSFSGGRKFTFFFSVVLGL